MHKTDSHRIWEIDFLRGVALILMIGFHFLYDLKEFFGYDVRYNTGLYFYIGKVSGILFILISAVSSTLSRSNIRRAVKYLSIAAGITIVSTLYDPDFMIKFGILHLLGSCILIYPILKKFNTYILIILGTIIIVIGQYLGDINPVNNYFFLFNMTNAAWVSADYYPLFPWLGVFIYGICVSRWLLNRESGFSAMPKGGFISLIGRHTLSVYLIHQPILLVLISTYIKLFGK